MKAGRGFPGFVEQLGLTERAESPEISIALAYPVPHLSQHRFPAGCGQQFGLASQAAVAAQHGGLKIVGGSGGFHLTHVCFPQAVAPTVFITSRAPGSLLAEAAAAVLTINQLPANNQLSTTFTAITLLAATVAAITTPQRWLGEFFPGNGLVLPLNDSMRVPPGHVLYVIHATANTLFQASVLGWDSCEDA